MKPTIEIKPLFLPYLIENNYRYFENNEKHITRKCEYFVIIFMLKNKLFFREDGEDVEIKSGEWYLQAPKLKQEGIYSCPCPEYYYMHFTLLDSEILSYNNEIKIDNRIQQSIYLPRRGNFIVSSYTKLFNKIEKLPSTPYEEFKRQLLFQKIFKNILDTTLAIKNTSEILADQIVEYISNNYISISSCKSLARTFNYSDDHISNIVKKYYGITPWQFVQKLRIEKTMELLTNTNYSVKSIANSVGYKDLSVFYKAFKHQTLMSPNKWRNSSRCI